MTCSSVPCDVLYTLQQHQPDCINHRQASKPTGYKRGGGDGARSRSTIHNSNPCCCKGGGRGGEGGGGGGVNITVGAEVHADNDDDANNDDDGLSNTVHKKRVDGGGKQCRGDVTDGAYWVWKRLFCQGG